MLRWGYHIYKIDDHLCFDQIVNGNAHSLATTATDAKRREGYYNYEMEWLGTEVPDQDKKA